MKEIGHGLHALVELIHDYGVLGAIGFIVGMMIVIVISAAWFGLAAWMIDEKRSLAVAYLGAGVAALGGVAVTWVAVFYLFDAEDTQKLFFFLASILYGNMVGNRDRHAISITLFGLLVAWVVGLYLTTHTLLPDRFPYYFASFTLSGALGGALLNKRKE